MMPTQDSLDFERDQYLYISIHLGRANQVCKSEVRPTDLLNKTKYIKTSTDNSWMSWFSIKINRKECKCNEKPSREICTTSGWLKAYRPKK